MLFVAFFYYENEKRLYFDLTKSNMQNLASKISSKIIYAHMSGTKFDEKEFSKLQSYKISYYSDKKREISGNLEKRVDFSKTLYQDGDSLILIDKSTWGHLGVDYIVIEDMMHFEMIKDLKISILLIFLFIYSCIAIVGNKLAKMFLKPIRRERRKLNNFIKDTTHELNTPISAILMSTEQETLNEKQVQRVRLSAKRISEVYKDLTYIFLQEEDNRKSEKLRLDEVLNEQLEYFGVLASKKRIKLTTDINEFSFYINRDDFIRVINNLISNAIKYNKTNGELHIELKNRTLIVKDSGIGIDKKKQRDIFKRYYRATTQEGGFGIGLNIVSHICRKYNIKIDIKSKEQKGTTFILKF